jgi:hypothetical protein
MISIYNNIITQYPCFCVSYLAGTEYIVLKKHNLLSGNSKNWYTGTRFLGAGKALTKWLTWKIIWSKSLFILSKHNVSEIGFCLRLQVKPIQLGSIDRDSTGVLDKDKTMDNVQKYSTFTGKMILYFPKYLPLLSWVLPPPFQ